MGQRTDDVLPLVDQVSGDERREQHALRPDEHPDRDLPVVETRGRVVVLGSVRVGGVRHLRMGDGYWLLVIGTGIGTGTGISTNNQQPISRVSDEDLPSVS